MVLVVGKKMIRNKEPQNIKGIYIWLVGFGVLHVSSHFIFQILYIEHGIFL